MAAWLDLDTLAFTLFGYPMSYVELVGTVTGLVSVWLAARANVWTWPVGLVNVLAFFVMFYQIRLYSDMLLQVYFFVTTAYGWYYWSQRDDAHAHGRIVRLSARVRGVWLFGMSIAIFALGAFMSRVHGWWPGIFPEPAAYPYPDAFTTILPRPANSFRMMDVDAI